MRTTLDIAGDVLFAASELAQREEKPLGQVIGELARGQAVGGLTTSACSTPPISGTSASTASAN